MFYTKAIIPLIGATASKCFNQAKIDKEKKDARIMSRIPQTIRFTIEDKYDYAKFHSTISKNGIKAARENADRILSNADLNAARELAGIRDAADEISQSNIDAAYIIASSIEESTERNIRNRDKNTEKVTTRLDQISTGIEDLKSLFDWKLSEMIWILEQQGEHFKQIIEILQRPLTTQAKELRNRAEYAYVNMLIPEAIIDFEESIKLNPYDFACYQSLGNIYLFHKNDVKKALEYYLAAVRYSTPQSKYYMAFAFLHAGMANYILEDYSEAYNATSNAIKSYPELSQAYYQHAKYCSRLGKYPEAISNLRKAFDVDRGYCTKALSEEDFVPMSSQLKDLVEIVTKDMNDKAAIEIEKANKLINELESVDNFHFGSILNNAKEKLSEGMRLKKEGKYFSCRDAIYKARVSQKLALDSVTEYLSDRESKLKKSDENIEVEIDNSKLKLTNHGEKIFPPGTMPTILGYALYFVKGLGLLMAIPIVLIILDDRNPIAWITMFSFILLILVVGIPLTIKDLYSIKKYNAKNTLLESELDAVRNELTRISQIRLLVESNILKLNLDKINLGPLEFEKHLRKTYG